MVGGASFFGGTAFLCVAASEERGRKEKKGELDASKDAKLMSRIDDVRRN